MKKSVALVAVTTIALPSLSVNLAAEDCAELFNITFSKETKSCIALPEDFLNTQDLSFIPIENLFMGLLSLPLFSITTQDAQETQELGTFATDCTCGLKQHCYDHPDFPLNFVKIPFVGIPTDFPSTKLIVSKEELPLAPLLIPGENPFPIPRYMPVIYRRIFVLPPFNSLRLNNFYDFYITATTSVLDNQHEYEYCLLW